MTGANDILKKFLDWVSSWDEWEVTDVEPAVLSDSDLAQFRCLVKNPSRDMKDWMEKYVITFWKDGMQEKDRPERKALFFDNSVSTFRENEGAMLADFWHAVADFELSMVHESNTHRVAYFESKTRLAQQAADDAKETLDYYTDMLMRAKRNEASSHSAQRQY